MTEEEWRLGLKSGDAVYVSTWGDRYRKEEVTRVTHTQIIVGRSRFRKRDGGAISASRWDKSWITSPEIAEGRIADIEAKKSDLEKRRDRVRIITRRIESMNVAELDALIEYTAKQDAEKEGE